MGQRHTSHGYAPTMTDWREDGLSQAQGIALIWEMDSARYLMRAAEKMIRSSTAIDLVVHPILTTSSIGVEKLLKLALGLKGVSTARRWPSKRAMREYGHGLDDMYKALRRLVANDLAARAFPGTPLRSALDAVDNDPLWLPLLTLLTRYGSRARFFHLDALAEDPQDGDAPELGWDGLEQIAIEHFESVRSARDRVFDNLNDREAVDRFQSAFHAQVADSLARFWDLMSALGTFDALGPRGKLYGLEINRSAVFMEKQTANL